jgi:hypothetical protein
MSSGKPSASSNKYYLPKKKIIGEFLPAGTGIKKALPNSQKSF